MLKTAINLSYRFLIFETSATALCGTTGRWVMSSNPLSIWGMMSSGAWIINCNPPKSSIHQTGNPYSNHLLEWGQGKNQLTQNSGERWISPNLLMFCFMILQHTLRYLVPLEKVIKIENMGDNGMRHYYPTNCHIQILTVYSKHWVFSKVFKED